MPFVALLGVERINALELSADQWTQLKESDIRHSLVFPGCSVRATAKTSKLGLHYFAHHRIAECGEPHSNESPPHLALKEAVSRFINEQPGWKAEVEYPGPRHKWVADVFAESGSGKRVVFEIQLTDQTGAEFENRSQVRFSDGALPVWITPHPVAAFPKLPVISTALSKYSRIPAASSQLLAEVVEGPRGSCPLGEQILFCLQTPWLAGDVKYQREKRDLEIARKEEAAAKAREATKAGGASKARKNWPNWHF